MTAPHRNAEFLKYFQQWKRLSSEQSKKTRAFCITCAAFMPPIPANNELLFKEMLIAALCVAENFRSEAKISTLIYRICINTASSLRAKIGRGRNRFESLDGKVFLAPALRELQIYYGSLISKNKSKMLAGRC